MHDTHILIIFSNHSATNTLCQFECRALAIAYNLTCSYITNWLVVMLLWGGVFYCLCKALYNFKANAGTFCLSSVNKEKTILVFFCALSVEMSVQGWENWHLNSSQSNVPLCHLKSNDYWEMWSNRPFIWMDINYLYISSKGHSVVL